MNKTLRILSGAAGLAAVALFVLPTSTAFTTIGGSLGLASNNYQRDFRIFNNTPDTTANDDQNPDANHPGALGAVKAVWKAGEAWNSDQQGQSGFDFEFQGESVNAGGGNDNVVSWETSSTCTGGVLAYMNPGSNPGISNGWTIRFCEGWNWNDGTGTQSVDIQGVGTHELGHALGLGHTGSGCSGSCSTASTMCPAICGNGQQQRSLQTDDKNGVAFIYGGIPANKPVITSLSGSKSIGGTLVINGSNFAATVNVKFTAGTTQNSGTIPGVVFNVPSTNGGTQVSVVIPNQAQDGVVSVWQPSNSRMSNPFPIDIGTTPPQPPTITNVNPSSVQALGGEVVTLTGTGFTGATSVKVGTTTLNPPLDFIVVNDSTITFPAPAAIGSLANVAVNVTTGNGTSNNGSLGYVLTNPLTLVGPLFLSNGSNATYKWGGKANQTTFLSVSATGATGIHNGDTLLLPLLLIQFPNTNAAGLGGFTAPINGALAGTVIHTQIWTLTGLVESTLEVSNIHQATVLF